MACGCGRKGSQGIISIDVRWTAQQSQNVDSSFTLSVASYLYSSMVLGFTGTMFIWRIALTKAMNIELIFGQHTQHTSDRGILSTFTLLPILRYLSAQVSVGSCHVRLSSIYLPHYF